MRQEEEQEEGEEEEGEGKEEEDCRRRVRGRRRRKEEEREKDEVCARTFWPGRSVPLIILPKTSNLEQSGFGKSFATWITRGPLGLQRRIDSAIFESCGPV